jgi:hypothetical protein
VVDSLLFGFSPMVSRVDFVRRLCSLHSRTVNCSVGSRSPVVLDFSPPASCMWSARRYNFFGSLVFLAAGLRPGRSRNWSALRSVFPGAFSPPLPYHLEFFAFATGSGSARILSCRPQSWVIPLPTVAFLASFCHFAIHASTWFGGCHRPGF